jgi:hypothetical protein
VFSVIRPFIPHLLCLLVRLFVKKGPLNPGLCGIIPGGSTFEAVDVKKNECCWQLIYFHVLLSIIMM